MSKNTVFLNALGADIYLSGGASTQTAYSGSGTPWTAESTTPYELAWTVGEPYATKPPEPIVHTIGGAPFSLATTARWIGYEPVTESFGVQMRGTNKDNAIILLRLLRNALTSGVSYISGSTLLCVKGGTNTAYYRLLGGTVVETADHVKEATSDSSNPYVIRAIVTWTRTPFGGLLTTPTTLINGTSWANAGTGTPDNVESLATGTGDMLDEGSPINITVRPSNNGSGDPVRRVILATVAARTYVGLSASNTWSTSGTTFATGGSISVWSNALDMSSLLGNYRLRFRLLGVNSAFTGSPEFRFQLFNGAGAGVSPIYSATVPPVNGDGNTTGRFIDSGPIPVTVQELRNLSDMNWSVRLEVRSTDGAATTGTLISVDALFYYDYCDVKFAGADWGTGSGQRYDMNLTTFAERSGAACLPLPYPQAMLTDPNNSNRTIEMGEIRGTAPRFYRTTSLYVRLLDAVGGGIVYAITTRTFTTTVVHAPLYRTLRGTT